MLFFLALSMGLTGILMSREELPYNSEGHHFDAEAGLVYQEQSMIGYGLLLGGSLLATLVFAYFAFRRRKGTPVY